MHIYDSIASILVLSVVSGTYISHAAFLLAICHLNLIFYHTLFLHSCSFPFTSLHIQLYILSSPQPQPFCPDNSCFCLCSPSSSKSNPLDTEKAVLETPILPPVTPHLWLRQAAVCNTMDILNSTHPSVVTLEGTAVSVYSQK